VSIHRTAIRFIAAALGALPLIACGSDRAGLSTAPTSVQSAAPQTTGTSPHVSPFDNGRTGENESEAVDGEAPVTSLVAGTSCPTLSFMIGQFKISVSGTTVFEGGVCTDIKQGARLEVKGTKTGTNIVASKIEFKEGGNGATEPVEGEGVVTSLATGTSCPTLQFNIGTFVVKLSATTTFVGGACADVKAGVKVEVKGVRNTTDRSITATSVTVKGAEQSGPEDEGEGVVSLVTGTSCPTLSFKIDEFTVSTTATTTYVGGACSNIVPGARLRVRGRITGEHTAVASKITFNN
jgi:hypothetical protein